MSSSTAATRKVLTGNNSTADLLGRNLGHVQNDNGGDETNTETSNETTSNHDAKTGRGSFENTTNDEDTASHDDSDTTPDKVSNVTSNDGTKEGTVVC